MEPQYTQRKPPSWGLGTPNTSLGETNHPRGMKHTIIRPYIKHPLPSDLHHILSKSSLVGLLEYNNTSKNSTVKKIEQTEHSNASHTHQCHLPNKQIPTHPNMLPTNIRQGIAPLKSAPQTTCHAKNTLCLLLQLQTAHH